jgi:hypothetical protein
MSATYLPRQLTDKYHDLMRERVQTVAHVEELDRELAALDYAFRVLDPDWEPPNQTQKKRRPCRPPEMRGWRRQKCGADVQGRGSGAAVCS